MKKTKGFTLVELMVVIVIIGILAALAIPKFMGATNKSKATEFKPVLKQIYTLQTAYKQERDSYSESLDNIGFDRPEATKSRFSYSYVSPLHFGAATYLVGKNIKDLDGKELTASEMACVDTFSTQTATTKLATLSNLDAGSCN